MFTIKAPEDSRCPLYALLYNGKCLCLFQDKVHAENIACHLTLTKFNPYEV